MLSSTESFVGCTVRLIGLSAESLNGAVGVVSSPPDPVTGRHAVMFKLPVVAVTAYPNGAKIQTKNLEIVFRDADKGPALKMNHWAKDLSPTDQVEWLVDCYRMRIDDDSKEGFLRGIYCPDATAWIVWLDFFVFCKRAALLHVLPDNTDWNWYKFIRCATLRLHQRFDKWDAKHKYGGENIFSQMNGGRSLRYTGKAVMESSSAHKVAGWIETLFSSYLSERGSADNVDFDDMQAWLGERSSVSDKDGECTSSAFFDVGGMEQWKMLYDALKCTIDKCCANPGCREPGMDKCGACKMVRYCGGECQKQHWVNAHRAECTGTKKNEVKPFDEVMTYVAEHSESCYRLQISGQHDEAITAAKKLLAYATVQFGEPTPGVDFRKRGKFCISNAKVDLDFASINILIGGSYVRLGTEKGIAKAQPFLTQARQQLVRWRLHLQRGLSLEIEDKWMLVSSVFSLNLVNLMECVKMQRVRDGRKYVVDTCLVLEQYKSILPGVSHEYGSVVLRISDYLTGISHLAVHVAQEEAPRIAQSEEDPVFVYAEKLIRFAKEIAEEKYGQVHTVTNQCARVTVDVLLEFPIVEEGDGFERLLQSIAKRVLDVSVQLEGADAENTGKAHYGMVSWYDRCCRAVVKSGDRGTLHGRTKISNYVKAATKHGLEVQRIYTRLYGERHIMVQQYKAIASSLKTWLN